MASGYGWFGLAERFVLAFEKLAADRIPTLRATTNDDWKTAVIIADTGAALADVSIEEGRLRILWRYHGRL